MWGLLQVCAACPTPHLKFELRPSWNNIHDTFPTRSVQDTTLLHTTTEFHLQGVPAQKPVSCDWQPDCLTTTYKSYPIILFSLRMNRDRYYLTHNHHHWLYVAIYCGLIHKHLLNYAMCNGQYKFSVSRLYTILCHIIISMDQLITDPNFSFFLGPVSLGLVLLL